MTYGENSGQLREALGALLRQHRIQQRIGGPGIHTVPEITTPTERQHIGEQVRRYRHGILLWCHQAVTSSSAHGVRAGTTWSPEPVYALRDRLREAVTASDAGLAPLEELTTSHPFDLVERWRLAARAAAFGEHDFFADVNRGHLSGRQRLTIIADAAQVTRALIVLDKRYHNIPGWQHLAHAGRLHHAAMTVVAFAGYEGLDFSVDVLGWRPAAGLITGPGKQGIAGVVQAEHNLLIHLNAPLTALNLKRVLDSQRALSHELETRIATTDPARAAQWHARAQAYARVFALTRDLGGLLGDGRAAALEGAYALTRLRQLPADAAIDVHALGDLDRLFDQIDARLIAVIDRGIKHRLYALKAAVAHIDNRDGHLVHTAPKHFTPLTPPTQNILIDLVRKHLRPDTTPSPPASRTSRQSRLDLEGGLLNRPFHPERPGPTL